MRISDWSSDVCSSDLQPAHRARLPNHIQRCRSMERETGIEPAQSAWKAEVLPLNYSRPDGTEKRNTDCWWREVDSNHRRRKPADLQSDRKSTRLNSSH